MAPNHTSVAIIPIKKENQLPEINTQMPEGKPQISCSLDTATANRYSNGIIATSGCPIAMDITRKSGVNVLQRLDELS